MLCCLILTVLLFAFFFFLQTFHLNSVVISLKEAVEAADVVVAAQNVPRSCLIALHANAMPFFWYR